MFKCSSCSYQGAEFHALVAKFWDRVYLYEAQCPNCGSAKVEVLPPIKESHLRISIIEDGG